MILINNGRLNLVKISVRTKIFMEELLDVKLYLEDFYHRKDFRTLCFADFSEPLFIAIVTQVMTGTLVLWTFHNIKLNI